MDSNSLKLLQQTPVFGGLESDALQFLLERCTSHVVECGDYFFREGDAGDSLFVIQDGEVLIEKDWEGKPVLIGNLGPGECLGEMSLIDLQPRSASARAVQPTRALEIHRTALAELFQYGLEPYAILMMNMGREVSRRLRDADERLFRLEQRLAHAEPDVMDSDDSEDCL